MSEASPRTLFDSLPKGEDLEGLFTLYRNPDGSTQAEFGPRTWQSALCLDTQRDEQENKLASGISLLKVFYNFEVPTLPVLTLATLAEFQRKAETTASLCRVLLDGLGRIASAVSHDFEALISDQATGIDKARVRRTLIRRIGSALDALDKTSNLPPHGNAATLEVLLPSGQSRPKPLAWVTLETARQLVEAKQVLPTKGDVQEAVESAYPKAKDFESGTWSKAFKGAGLDALPERAKFQTRPGWKKKRERAREQARKERKERREARPNSRKKEALRNKGATRRKQKP